MKQLQKIRGLSLQQIAHIPILATSQLDRDREKTQNLIQKCMKSLIRQKMSGCLINIKRKKSHSPTLYNSYLNSFMQIQHHLNDLNRKYIPKDNPQKQICTRFQAYTKRNQLIDRGSKRFSSSTISEKKQQFKNFYHQYNKTKVLGQSMKIKQQQKKQDKQINASQKKLQSSQLSNDTISFRKQKDRMLQLPRLRSISKSKFQHSSLSYKKNFQELINEDLWKIITRERGKNATKKMSSNTMTDANSLCSTVPFKQQKKLLIRSTHSSKQKFMDYVHHLPNCFKRLLQLTLSFLQIRLPSQLTYQSYVIFVEELLGLNQRIWSVLVFLYWDVNRDGIITSRDIFNVFKQLNNFQQKNENHKPLKKIQQTERHQDQKICENILRLQNVQRALSLFKKQIQRVNQLIHDHNQNVDNSLQGDNIIAVNYLEEGLLTEQNLKYKEVAILIQRQNHRRARNRRKNHQKSLSEIQQLSQHKQTMFVGKVNSIEIKKSREKLQMLKNELRQKRKLRMNENQQRIKNYLPKNNQLIYVQVIKYRMGDMIKDVVQNLLGLEI